MIHHPTNQNISRPTSRGVAVTLTLVAAAVVALSIAATAAGAGTHRVKLHSTLFAAQVGSTTAGGSVYAGALPDPRLGHGAIVFVTSGSTMVTVTFHEFFALGSIKGAGSVTLTPRSGGQATLTGSLKINGGTGGYRNARGRLTANGTIDKAGMVHATLTGSFTH